MTTLHFLHTCPENTNCSSSSTDSTLSISTPLPSQTPSPTPSQIPIPTTTNEHSDIFTTLIPVTTVTNPTTTYTSWSQSVVSTPFPQNSHPTNPATMPGICAGEGLDAAAQGLLASLIVPTVIGLVIWLIFAIIRPRFRQVYALREWFVQQDLRPRPLGSSLWAFLFPPVPLVPDAPNDVSNAGRSPEEDAELFPSDEQLSQRALWISFLIACGWSVIGLAGALPLYLVSTPCVQESSPLNSALGGYSTLQDISLLRLLKLLDNNEITTTRSSTLLATRAVVNGEDVTWRARVRVIILTALVIILGVAPALWKILKEFNVLVAYRQRWINVRCQGAEMAWLSARKAPGFAGWGEKRLKDFIVKSGLSVSLDSNGTRTAQSRGGSSGRRSQQTQQTEEGKADVDVQALFTIGDTHALALLIDERDEILENLEVAETKYISSFRLTTPDPSLADFMPPPPPPPDRDRPYISRPLPLNGHRKPPKKRSLNPAFAASSLAPTTFVAPSQYYKLHGIRGVSGGRLTGPSFHGSQQSLSDAFHSRIIGSRFQEVNRSSPGFNKLAIGSPLRLGKSGEIGPHTPVSTAFDIPDPRRYGPNYEPEPIQNAGEDEEWVDVMQEEEGHAVASEENGGVMGSSTFRRPFHKRLSSTRRETFPLRKKDSQAVESPDDVLPPHLRVQHTAPFVRPLSGVDYDKLGDVYSQIRMWRSQLKLINNDIAEAQNEAYGQIAEGTNIKGWLLIGRGLRFIDGVELIEGRAKEDIRWDVLQDERDTMDSIVVWGIVIVSAILLAVGLAAATALALSGAPEFSRIIPFLQKVESQDNLAGGLATVLAPSFAAVVFTAAALWIVHWVTRLYGRASISGTQLLVFKTIFAILVLFAGVWLVAAGAILFAIGAFDRHYGQTGTIAEGSIYIAVLVLAMILNVAIIVPGLLLLQPRRLWRVIKSEKFSFTPRQRFRAVYPRTYDPSYATATCILGIVFASAFAVVFPLVGPAVAILLCLTLIAHRYLIGYVYGRTHSQTGGVLQIWLVKRFGTLLALQPLLLGLILLSRRLWEEGGVLVGTALFVIVFVEAYTTSKSRLPGKKSLTGITQDSLEHFSNKARNVRHHTDDERTSLVSEGPAGALGRARGSMASVLEMMSLTLAVMPSPSRLRGPVPLQTETLDDLTATERAARTHPDAPPHLPALPFADHAEEMAGILYAPEMIAPPPIIWLPNDTSGVARSEALDLQRYHDLRCTLDVGSTDDVTKRERTTSTRSNRRPTIPY